MPLSYDCPPCPDSPQSPRYARMPGKATCPRSDTYRAIESGDNHNRFGWLFRCRTCGTGFFRESPEMHKHAMRQADMARIVREAQARR